MIQNLLFFLPGCAIVGADKRGAIPLRQPSKNETTMTTKSDLRNEAKEICGCILDDCPISGDLLAKLRWIRANGMGLGTEGEIDAAELDALITKASNAS